MKNLVLVTFSWLMMLTIIGSIIHSMTFLTVLYANGNEIGQFLWNCLTALLLIPAYKGIYYIHSLWTKTLRDFRERPYQEDNSAEIPFFREPSLSVVHNETATERPMRVTPPLSAEEVNKKLEEIRSSVNEKINKIKGEDVTNPKKDASYFANKYTSEKSILVETLFDKEKEEVVPESFIREEHPTEENANAHLGVEVISLLKKEVKEEFKAQEEPQNAPETLSQSIQEKKTTKNRNKGHNHKKHYSKKRK